MLKGLPNLSTVACIPTNQADVSAAACCIFVSKFPHRTARCYCVPSIYHRHRHKQAKQGSANIYINSICNTTITSRQQ